jgi:two-component system, CitB family, response regulator DctR
MTAVAVVRATKTGQTRDGVWKVMIVEDNPEVAALHRRLVDDTPNFRSVHIATNGEAAFRALTLLRPDLAIIDLTMPGGDGLTFLRRVRRESIPVEAIIVTASRGAQTVREAMHLGVVDYLVKPFAPERLRQSLTAFAWRARAFQRPQLMQDEVDLVQSSGAPRLQRLPKGLKRTTLVAVKGVLDEGTEALTAEEVGQRIGVARVTARRYLEYLDVIGAACVERECTGPGRPRNRYRKARRPGEERR